MNISLPESLRSYLEEQVTKNGYSTASEYIGDLILQDQKRKSQEDVEILLLEALQSGEATAITEADWSEIRQAVQGNSKK